MIDNFVIRIYSSTQLFEYIEFTFTLKMHNYSRSKETLDKRELYNYITDHNKIGRNEKEERRKSIILLYD